MATDNRTSLPIRSEADGADERVHVKIVDKLNPDSQQMVVDSDSNAHVEIHGNDPAGVDRVVRVAENGAVQSDGVYDASNNSKPSHQGVVAQERNASAADSRQTMRPTAKRGSSDTDVVAIDMSLHDEDGNKYSTSNPLPVVVSNEEVGTAIHEYHESATSIAKDATYTYTYTVATANLSLKKITATASGRIKAEVLVGSSSSPTQRYTKFNSSACPNVEFDTPRNSVVAVGDVVQVKITNMDTEPMTGYVMIEGTSGA